MSIIAKIFEKAVGVREAGTSAFLALALGTAPDAANRIGFYADTTGAAEQLVVVVGAQSGPAFQRSGSSVLASALKVQDSTFQICDNSDITKTLAFQVGTQSSGFQLTIDVGAQAANRTLSVPVLSGNRTLSLIDQAQTVSGAQTFTGGATFSTAGLTVTDIDVALGTTTGTKWGTSTAQKQAWYNATPVVQQTGDVATALAAYGLVASPTIIATSAIDSTFQIKDNSDPTKTLAFQVGTQSSGFQLTIDVGAQVANRTLSVPALTGAATLMVLSETQTVTGAKTFSQPVTVDISATNGGITLLSDDDKQATVTFYNRSGSGCILYRPISFTGLNVYSSAATTDVMSFDNAALSSGSMRILYTTASTSTTTGSLVNAGGFGNAGAAYFGGTVTISTAGNSAVPSGGLTLTDPGNTNKRLVAGVNNASDQYFLQAAESGVDYKPINLNPNGGAIIIGTDPGGSSLLRIGGTLIVGGHVTLSDAANLIFNTTTGTKIGTAVGQKFAFWNATPIVQPSGANQAALINSTGGTYDGTLAAIAGTGADAALNNNFTDLFTLLNEMRSVLVNTGLMKGAA